MSDHRRELAIQRERQLAGLRTRLNRPERFTLPFACAERDIEYLVTFSRLSPASRFTCETVERDRKPSPLDRLQGLFRPRGDGLTVPASDVEFGSVACAGCGRRGNWTHCGRCRAFVCGCRSRPGAFVCRKSCGASFETKPLRDISAARGGVAGRPAIGSGTFTAPPKHRRET